MKHFIYAVSSALFLLLSIQAEVKLSDQLPVDPKLYQGQLENGLKYLVYPNQRPVGKISIYLHIDSGSVNEEDHQQGIAHFLEHMAFNGSENFAPGTLIKYFESLGLTFGTHQNAFTGFDQTTYTITLPNTDAETLDKGFLCMSDYAYRLTLPQEEIDSERPIILEEDRARAGARKRLIRKLLPELLPDSRVKDRLPIGITETIKSVQRQDFVDYYTKWYHPENATVIVVGDIKQEEISSLLKKHFGAWKKQDNPAEPLATGIKPYTEDRAFVLTDPELSTAEVSIVNIREMDELKTIADFKRNLTAQLGIWILNKRLSDKIREGESKAQGAYLSAAPFLNVCNYIDVEAEGKVEDWRTLLKDSILEVKRGVEYGFLEQEIADAHRSLIASAEEAVKTEATRDSNSMIYALNRTISKKQLPMAAQQRLDLLKSLLPSISSKEIHDKFIDLYGSKARLFILQLPDKEGIKVPNKKNLLRLAKAFNQIKVSKPLTKERAEKLLEEEPEVAKITETKFHEKSKVTTFGFENCACVHHKEMDYKKDQVNVSISLHNGPFKETEEEHGFANAATLIFNQPKTKKLSSTQIKDLMLGKNVRVGASAEQDRFIVSISGTPDDLETGFQLAHLLIKEGQVSEQALKLFQENLRQQIALFPSDARMQLREQIGLMMSGNDKRFKFVTNEQVDNLSVEKVQKYFDEKIKPAGMEVSIVGDLELKKAETLAAKYLGSLPKRANSPTKDDPARQLNHNKGAQKEIVEVDTVTPTVFMLAGYRLPGWINTKEKRGIAIASQVLDSRLHETIREKEGLTYSASGFSRVSNIYKGKNFVVTYFTAKTENIKKGSKVTLELLEKLAKEGPTDEEMTTVLKQFSNIIKTSQQKTSYWSNILGELSYHGYKLDEVISAPEGYAAFTKEEIAAILKKYFVKEHRFELIVKPKGDSSE